MAYTVGNKKQVFINWDLIEPGYGVAWRGEEPGGREVPFGVRLKTHPPRLEAKPLLVADQPWETFINVYASIFQDEDRYRLYYECYYIPEHEEQDDLKALLAYAESFDGKTWTKPTVGALHFEGSPDNNLVYGLELARWRSAHGASVFKDPNPDAPAAERYKMIHMGKEQELLAVFGAISADGLHWKPLEHPLIQDYMSDTQSIVYFDAELGKYRGYFRGWRGYERGRWHGRRAIAYAETDDFRNWPRPEIIVEPDLHDPPEVDIYTNSYTPWPETDAHLMFPAFYQRTLDTTQVHLLSSRDGKVWHRPSRNPIIATDDLGAAWAGGAYAGCGLVSLGSMDVSLLISPVWHTHNQPHYASGRMANPPHRGMPSLATWRKDGFMSLEAESLGCFTTVPLIFKGHQLELNVLTRFGGEIRVEVIDPTSDIYVAQPRANAYLDFEQNSDAIPGYSFRDCDPITGDHIEHIVSWQGKSDLSRWAGKPIRLRFWLNRAHLYALRFGP